jgi:hypothetical protein
MRMVSKLLVPNLKFPILPTIGHKIFLYQTIGFKCDFDQVTISQTTGSQISGS